MVDANINLPDDYEAVWFTWDKNSLSKKLELTNDDLTVTVNDGTAFKSVLGNTAMTPGKRYYFEIFLDNGSLIKIGVARRDVNLDMAFSDTEHGWAMYNGELRHASNSTGSKYGSVIKSGDTIGVMVDMVEGKLGFTRNGEHLGTAFESDDLMKGELYAACSPIYTKDRFTLKMLLRED